MRCGMPGTGYRSVYGHSYKEVREKVLTLTRELAREKEECGVSGFLTQPVMSERAFGNLARAHAEMPDMRILGGVIPVVSERNALFMNNEVAGIEVPEEIAARYHGLGREDAEALAVELSVGFARRMEPYTAGWYFMTPFQRVALIERILTALRG